MGRMLRIRNLWRRGRVDAEIEAELHAHLEMAAQDVEQTGISQEDARRQVRLRFGNPVRVREQTVAEDAALELEGVWRDSRLALRQLRKSPGFSLTAVLTLALGIGATTAIFTLIQQVMLRSLPVEKPQQLWRIGDSAICCFSSGYTQGNEDGQNDWNLFSGEGYKRFRANTPAFKDLAAFEIGDGNAQLAVRRAGSPESLAPRIGQYVSGNFFQTFGASAWRGRLFSDAEDEEGAPPVAVMSFHTWQEDYGADPSVVGATYEFNGHVFTVIGIGPPQFYGAKVEVGGMPDFWMPLTKEPLIAGDTSRLKNPSLAWLDLIGRIQPGGSPSQLQAQLQGELHAWLASHVSDMSTKEKAFWHKQTLHLTPGGAGVSRLADDYKSGLVLLLLAALSVLLLACANLASLLLARGLRNRQQTAVHVALGSPRRLLVRRALVESVMLAVIGGVAGVGVAWAGAKLILHLAFGGATQSIWIPIHAQPSLPVLLFAFSLSLITGVAFGVAPAWITSHAEPTEAMRGAKQAPGERFHWAQSALVIVQLALSLVLLSLAAMLGKSLQNQEQEKLGFDPVGRYLVSVDPKISGIQQAQLPQLFQNIEERLRTIPGVRSVGAVLEAPPGGWITHDIRIEGKPEPAEQADALSGWTRVTPGFFPAFADSIVLGRSMTDDDTAATRPVAVVNEAFAKKFFGTLSPIGQHFGPAPGGNAGMYEIVGVASDMVFEEAPNTPMYFLPEAQSTTFADPNSASREAWSHYLYNIVVWAPDNPPALAGQVKNALAEIAPDLVLYSVEPYPEVIRNGFTKENMVASLSWLFSAIGLVLASVGLYGVTTYGVEQCTKEIGVRMALGANRGSVVALVLRTVFGQFMAGLVIGIPATIGAGYLMASELVGVKPWNPALLGASALLLGTAAFVAAWLPARRAAGVDPMHALRNE